MLYLAILTFLTIFLYFLTKRMLDEKINISTYKYQKLVKTYDKLFKENEALKASNSESERLLHDTIGLYDITREIRKVLDENRIFALFKEHINKHVRINDCLWLDSGQDISKYKNDLVIPITINKNNIGYLVAVGLNQNDEAKFKILAHQFISGIKGARLFKKIQELTVTDSLTEIFNRRYFLERYKEELERSRKFKYNLSFLMIDVDHFKDFNDHYGHLVGDAILREVTKTIKENIRQIDFMGRYGGEEISVVLTETNKEQAGLAAERIRHSIETKNIKVYDEEIKVTISIGIATFPFDTREEQKLIDFADQALYRAKEEGRNRTCMYGSTR